MGRNSVIIVGGGIAGLATGCYLQMNGYQTRIFEQHSQPGGLAAWWRRGDFMVDGGIHFLISHRPGTAINDIYREIGTADPSTLKDMDTFLRFTDMETGESIDFTCDVEKLQDELLSLSPSDERAIRDLMKEVQSMKDSDLLSDMGMSVAPPELKGRLSSLKEMWEMRSFIKYFMGKFAKSARAYTKDFQNRFVADAIQAVFGPTAPLWFVIMIMASVASRQLGLLTEGCRGFIMPIVERYQQLGGDITYNALVDKILVENDSAVGVVLGNETEHLADAVVSAADGQSTIFRLLEGLYTDDVIRKIYADWRRYDSMFVISYCVNRTFDDMPPMHMFKLPEPLVIGSHKNHSFHLRIFNYGCSFAPEGKTVIQVMLESDWESWNRLRQDHDAYKAEKERYEKIVRRHLEKQFPGLNSQIEVTDVATPHTVWRFTRNSEGSPMGWLMTRESLMTPIRRTLPGLSNFYMAGQWVLPGGGVPGCVYTGRNVAQIMCKEDGKPFRTSMPEQSFK